MDCSLKSLVTEADEALAAVILENNFEEWDMLARGLELDKENRQTRYTHGGKEDVEGPKKGWSLEGKQQYNTMFDAIAKLRKDADYGENLESEKKGGKKKVQIKSASKQMR